VLKRSWEEDFCVYYRYEEVERTKKTTIIVYAITLKSSLENGPMHALKPPYFSSQE
jgi:hypothetical protein